VNYIGTHAVHLLDRRNISQPYGIPAASLSFCQAQDNTGAYINLGVAPCTTTSRLPYPNYNGFYIDSDWHGYSHYNGLNVKFERRSANLALTSVYTWANSKDDKSAAAGVGATGQGFQGTMDNHHPELDYGPSDFDVDQRFVASYVYDLPFGRGQKFGNSVNRATELLIGGWETTGIVTFQTGFPYSITANDLGGVLQAFPQRANLVSGCNVKGNLTEKFQRLNFACFNQSALGVYGNTKRNWLRQPGINNFDMGFAKNFHFTESLNFKLGLDTFNTWNHHQYAGATGALIGTGSGGNNQIDSGLGDATAGYITGAASAARVLQISGKFTF
jgi:hypothetical protein